MLLACITAFCMTACGSDDNDSGGTGNGNQSNIQTPSDDENSGSNGENQGGGDDESNSNNGGENEGTHPEEPSQPGHKHEYVLQVAEEEFLATVATCTEEATYYFSCQCGEKASKTFKSGKALGHNYVEWASNGDSSHTKICSNDNEHIAIENCTGGKATCTERAVCDLCCEQYGELAEHTYDILMHNETEHWFECICGDKDDFEGHKGGNPTCSKSDKCDVCGENYYLGHIGGEATCQSLAVCEECGASYGVFARHDYVNNYCIWCNKEMGTQGLQYRLINNDTEYEVCGLGSCNDKKIVIPEVNDDKEVTRIADGAFANCSSLTSIVIPDSVMSIGDSAFSGCSSLTSIEIPDSVTSIGDDAFSECSIKKATIPAHAIPYIKSSVLKEVVITSGENINSSAFYNCSSLTSIVIPDSVTSIGEKAFYKCSSLTSITFNGTKNEWKSITKYNSWNYNVPARKVICSDGEVALG